MLNLKRYCLSLICFFVLNLHAQIELQTQIDSILKVYDTTNSPGLAIRVIKDSNILYSKGFGIANLDYNIKNSDSTIYSLASISKQFTAAAVWALINEAKLSLEDSLSQIFPDFPNYDTPIQIKHLLNHTSGIRNYHTLMYLSGFDYHKEFYDNTTVFNLAKQQKNLNNIPGEKVIYSNTNYNILALIVEELSGQNLDDYLKTKVLNSLGMTDTFVRVSHGKIIKNLAIGYQKQNGEFVYNTTNQLSYGAGSIGSNLKDMSIWIKMLNEQIPAFKDLSRFLKTPDTLNNGNRASYARGIMVDEYKGYKVASHGGFGFGGQSHLIVVPEEHIGIIIMTNLQSINPTSISYKLLDMLLFSEENTSQIAHKPIPFEAQDLAQFTGEYREINSDMTMHITVENDTLKARSSMGKTSIPLLQNNRNVFVRRYAQNVKYDFTKTNQYDMTVSFGGTPFYFNRTKLIKENPKNLSDYVGHYYSKELETTYTFFIEDDALKLSYRNNKNTILYPVQLNAFGNRNRTLYQFMKASDNKIYGMYLSCDGQVRNIEFIKDQTQY